MRGGGNAYGTVMHLPRTIAGMNSMLIIAGLACLAVCGFLFYKLMPHDGKEPSAWTGTDTRGTAVALGLLVLLLAGASMVAKGVLA